MDFSQRSYQPELLDGDNISQEDIHRNMQELNTINSWLGGHAITLSGFRKLLPHSNSSAIHICEIGCGGGDNLLTIQKWCQQQGVDLFITGIDSNPYCIEVASQTLPAQNSQLIVSDYRNIQFPQKPDIIFSSLFCHHFSDKELVKQLQWMKMNARTGFFINDLHRHKIAYHSIKYITALFSNSHLVKNDAPLSVARSFSKKDWQKLLHNAGITNFSLHWKWAFRWLITVPSI